MIIALCFIAWIVRFIKRRKQRRLREADPDIITIQDIDSMRDGSEFELYLYRLFTELGYEDVIKTTSSKDFGADLVFMDRSGVRCVVQAKRYAPQHPVGLGAVQEVYASMRYYEAEKSIVLTSGVYTAACRTLAAVNEVRLMDRDDLIRLIKLYKSGRDEAAFDLIEAAAQSASSPWRGGRELRARR
ncbi:restriction endonuclease [Paenibacillaceae bacterium]|nr:restriction endonuclease [Paenibacillaceae bacterium]